MGQFPHSQLLGTPLLGFAKPEPGKSYVIRIQYKLDGTSRPERLPDDQQIRLTVSGDTAQRKGAVEVRLTGEPDVSGKKKKLYAATVGTNIEVAPFAPGPYSLLACIQPSNKILIKTIRRNHSFTCNKYVDASVFRNKFLIRCDDRLYGMFKGAGTQTGVKISSGLPGEEYEVAGEDVFLPLCLPDKDDAPIRFVRTGDLHKVQPPAPAAEPQPAPESAAAPQPESAAAKAEEPPEEKHNYEMSLCRQLQNLEPALQQAMFLTQPLQIAVPDDRLSLCLLLMQTTWVQARLQDSLKTQETHISHLEQTTQAENIKKPTLEVFRRMRSHFQHKGAELAGEYDSLMQAYQQSGAEKAALQDKTAKLGKTFHAAELLHYADITYIYEYYCFYRLVKGILELGFDFTGNSRVVFEESNPPKGSLHLANIITFRQRDIHITLYREPIVHNTCKGDDSQHGLYIFNDSLGPKWLTPDFGIKIEYISGKRQASYVILDAKWQEGKEIHAAHTLATYARCIRPFHQQDRIDMVWTFQGRKDTDTPYPGISRDSEDSGSPRALAYRNCIVREKSGDAMDFFWQEFRKLL